MQFCALHHWPLAQHENLGDVLPFCRPRRETDQQSTDEDFRRLSTSRPRRWDNTNLLSVRPRICTVLMGLWVSKDASPGNAEVLVCIAAQA